MKAEEEFVPTAVKAEEEEFIPTAVKAGVYPNSCEGRRREFIPTAVKAEEEEFIPTDVKAEKGTQLLFLTVG